MVDFDPNAGRQNAELARALGNARTENTAFQKANEVADQVIEVVSEVAQKVVDTASELPNLAKDTLKDGINFPDFNPGGDIIINEFPGIEPTIPPDILDEEPSEIPPLGDIDPEFPPGDIGPEFPPGDIGPEFPPGDLDPEFPPGDIGPEFPPGDIDIPPDVWDEDPSKIPPLNIPPDVVIDENPLA